MSSRPAPARLFVYGTLGSAFDNRWAKLLRESAEPLGSARVRGSLFRVAHYPGMKRSAARNQWVWGEVYRLRNPQKLWNALDRYEGSAFRRVVVTAHLETARARTCWAYEYLPRIPSTRRIPSGRFTGEPA